MPDRSRTTAPHDRPKAVPDAKASAELSEHLNRRRQLRRTLDELKERLPGLEVRSGLAELKARLSEFKAITAEYQKLYELYPNAVMDEVLRAEFLEELGEANSSLDALGVMLAKLTEGLKVRAAMLAKLKEGLKVRAAKPEPTRSPLVRSKHLAPPVAACFLLDLLLAKVDRNVIPGDLREEFGARLAKYGPRGAHLWFWTESMKTIATRNPVCRSILVGGLMRLGEWIFRQIGG